MGNPEKTLTPATSKLAPTIKKFMKFSELSTSDRRLISLTLEKLSYVSCVLRHRR